MNMDRKEAWAKEMDDAMQGLAAPQAAVRLAQAFRAMGQDVPQEWVEQAKAIMPAKERRRLTVSFANMGQAWAGARGPSGSGDVVMEVGESTIRLSFEEVEAGYLVQGRIGSGPWFLDTADGPVEIQAGTRFEQVVPSGEAMRFWNSTDEFEVPALGTMHPEGA